eukprot:273844-Hanusia_phi.AAC.3
MAGGEELPTGSDEHGERSSFAARWPSSVCIRQLGPRRLVPGRRHGAVRGHVTDYEHAALRVLMDAGDFVAESDVENWPVWRCKVQRPGASCKRL